jgi:hypothetical protein
MAAAYPWGEEKLTPKELASYYDAAFLAGEWYLNTQNTGKTPGEAFTIRRTLGASSMSTIRLSLIFNLRYEGRQDLTYHSIFGWDEKPR